MLVNAVAPFEGKLHWIGTPREGQSRNTGEPWKMVDFVLCWQDSQMQEKFMVFSASGVEKVNRILSTPIGTPIRVTWMPDSNTFQGQDGTVKWFPSYRAIGFNVLTQQAPAQAQQYPPQQPAPQYPQSYQQPAGYPQQGTMMPQQAPAYPQQQAQIFPQRPADDDIPF